MYYIVLIILHSVELRCYSYITAFQLFVLFLYERLIAVCTVMGTTE